MPTKKPAPLPDSLRYLQPFANALAKLPPEDLDESVDATRLEAALRERLRGLDEAAAEAALAKDRDQLERWLKDKPVHPAHWIHGFLLFPDLSTHLTRPAEPRPRGPEILFEAPIGWKMKPVPFRLDLKAGEVTGSITAIDESMFGHMQLQRERAAKMQLPGVQVTSEVFDVSFESCSGKKYLQRMTAPAPWKQVDYALRVPGGFVSVWLGTRTGAEFDESPLEGKLHTLRLTVTAQPSDR